MTKSNEVEVGEAPFPDPKEKPQMFISSTPSVGKNRYNRLVNNDFNTLNDLYQASVSELADIDSIGRKTALDIKIAVGDELVERLNISNKQLNNMSVKEIADLYGVCDNNANEIKQNHIEPEREITHISERNKK